MNTSLSEPKLTELRIIHVGDGVATAQVGKTCIALWRRGVTPVRQNQQNAALKDVCGQFASGAGFLCVIEPTSDPPSEELRRLQSEVLRDLQDKLSGTACVVEGDGFRAGLARAVLRSMELIMGSLRFPTRFFARSPEAASWLATRTRGSAAPVIEAVATLRRELTRVDGAA